MADRPEVFYGTELVYSSVGHCYTLKMDTLFSNSELAVIAKILVGCRALAKDDLKTILEKLRANTTPEDRNKISELINKELLHYTEPASDCESVIENIWKLTECINAHNLISIYYHRMDRKAVDHRLLPASIMFSDGYFYFIAFRFDKETEIANDPVPLFFRIDRISQITVHRTKYTPGKAFNFDEGDLRNHSQFMWPGPVRHIKFEFTGPSVQAILDKIPSAKIVSREKNGKYMKYLIEAETRGNGIKMYLLSQGSWVKVLSPTDFVDEMKKEVRRMAEKYGV